MAPIYFKINGGKLRENTALCTPQCKLIFIICSKITHHNAYPHSPHHISQPPKLCDIVVGCCTLYNRLIFSMYLYARGKIEKIYRTDVNACIENYNSWIYIFGNHFHPPLGYNFYTYMYTPDVIHLYKCHAFVLKACRVKISIGFSRGAEMRGMPDGEQKFIKSTRRSLSYFTIFFLLVTIYASL